jgi:hypothetical protein
VCTLKFKTSKSVSILKKLIKNYVKLKFVDMDNPWVLSFQVSAAAVYTMRYRLILISNKLIKICSTSAALDCPELKINAVHGESIRNAAQ